MMDSDIGLAEALWHRCLEFAKKRDYYNALLDVSASYRLFAYHKNPHADELYPLWVTFYNMYKQQAKLTQDNEILKPVQQVVARTDVSQLQDLLSQIGERRRK